MRILIYTLSITLTSLSFVSAQDEASAKKPETIEEKISYTIGSQIGSQLKNDGLAIAPEVFLTGVLDALEGKDPKMTQEEMRDAMLALQQSIQEKAAADQAENLAKNKEFFEKNGKKEGIITTKSGLQYEVLKSGEGDKPGVSDTIVAHYHGTLLDGTVFDSSVDRGEPASFPVGRVIPGWTEALQLMSVGSKWRLYIPSDLAYGERGSPPVIQPNSALIFDVELLEIQ